MSGYYLVPGDRESEERWDDDTNEALYERGGTDWDSVRESMPPPLATFPEWVETYANGYTLEDAVRWALGPEGEPLTDSEVAMIFDQALSAMAPEDAENFLRSIGRAFQSALPIVGKVAQVALPIVGGAVGSLIAPGVGTAIGGALGQAAGGMIGRAAQGPASRAPSAAVRAAVPRGVSAIGRNLGAAAQGAAGAAAPHLVNAGRSAIAAAAPGASSAVQELLRLLNNPQLLGSVANAAMGGTGQGPGGGAAFGQLMGALSQVATEAAAEVHEGYATQGIGAESVQSAEHARTLVQIIGEVASQRAAP